jgi:GDP-L-fucose synthase
MIRKFHQAKIGGDSQVILWGTGTPLREFLHVDDLARGVVYCHDHYDEYEHINCGLGFDMSIRELATKIGEIVGFEGEIVFDSGKPDGMPRKLMDSSRMLALGWAPEISLDDGLASAYRWFLDNVAERPTSARNALPSTTSVR